MMMNSFFKVLVALALVCGCFGASLGSNDVHNDTCPKSAHVDCKCGVKTVKVPVELCHNEKTDQCGPCKESLGSALKKCDRYKYCSSCNNNDGTCDSCLSHRTGPYCETEQNKTVVSENNGRRLKRGSHGKCVEPELNAATYECIETPEHMRCEVQCIWGHELPKGEDVQYFECHAKTGKWEPYEIQDCKSYVKCELSLISTKVKAEKKCSSAHRFEPIYCDVTCGSKTTKHHCSESGNWYPSLPECAKPS